MGSFHLLDHTSEVGIEAHAACLEELFAQAATGMFSLMVDLGTIREMETREVEATGSDLTALLVAWLNELLYLFDLTGLLFRRFQVRELDERHIKALCYGERLSPGRHTIKLGVKAATYHLAQVGHNGGWRARVLLDI